MIFDNPFYILGATTRDTRQKIIELSDEKMFELSEDLCQKARSELTMPKKRLLAELNWFPGISPSKALNAINLIYNNNYNVFNVQSLTELSKINIICTILKKRDFDLSDEELEELIIKVVQIFDTLSIEYILRDINEDRKISLFPLIDDTELIKCEIEEKQRICVKSIINRLNSIEINNLIKIVTRVVNITTKNGSTSTPQIINNLIDDYQLHTKNFLLSEYDKIKQLIQAIHDNASFGESAVFTFVKRLIDMARKWDAVAQPIQLNAKSIGINDELSMEVANSIRSLGVYLFNEYNYLELSKMISDTLKELFAELPDVFEQVNEDIHQLNKIEKEEKQRLSSLQYTAEIGIIFKDTLRITSDVITWKGEKYPVKTILGITWGATQHSINGIPTGTVYMIKFKTTTETIRIETNRNSVYTNAVDILWQIMSVKIINDMLLKLKNGKYIVFSNLPHCLIWNDGITLQKSEWFTTKEKRFKWNQVDMWSSCGNLIICSKEDSKFIVQIPYQTTYNIHFLEAIVAALLKKPEAQKISDVFLK
ncbi:MAG: hypothetical protein LBB59_05100 [Campylobacteraceae bacterium]|jgi:hypothetical protein|nr:hypothetical protein [Campylobacteraceae bacterium]